MPELMDTAAKALETALTAKDPIKALMDMAKEFLSQGRMENLHEIDIVLGGRFIDYVRRGTKDDLESLAHNLLAFIEGKNGDRLQSLDDGRTYYERWEHLCDLAEFALENYDPEFITRFIASRKRGEELMKVLYHSRDGVRANDLAKRLGISPPNLAKLLREFEKENLIIREREGKTTLVRLDFPGRAFLAGKESPLEKPEKEPLEDRFKNSIGGLIGFPPKELLSPGEKEAA